MQLSARPRASAELPIFSRSARETASALTLRLAVAAFAAQPIPLLAQIEEQTADTRIEYFADSDDVHVTSWIAEYALGLVNKARLAISFNRERVVIPGVAAPPGSQEAVDSISGASRPISATQDPFADYTKMRNQLDSTVQWRGLSAGYYVSGETDYFAQQLSGGYERPLFGDKLQLSIAGSYGWDDIKPLEDDDTQTAPDRRTTLHGSVVATQVLSSTTIAQFGVEWNEVEGLQHSPYRSVYVAGAYQPEVHPDARTRRDVFVKLNQFFATRSSAKLAYTYYTDDWGVGSHTIGAKLHQYVGDDVVVRYRYRYYTQTAANFYRDDYTEAGGVGGLRTADYRLGDFDAHLFGTRLEWNLGRGPIAILALDGIRVNIDYERYFNSNNFSANIFESGVSFSF